MSAETGRIVLEEAQVAEYEALLDRYLGSLLGGSIADALGWITEFRSSRHELERRRIQRIDEFITWSKPTGGRFHTYIDYVSEGEYSDDTQLTLCTARSVEGDGAFNPIRFTEELRAWLDYARGAGAAVTAAARNLTRWRECAWYSNFHRSGDRHGRRGYVDAGGNGAAMRVSPLALANRDDPERMVEGVWQNAVITHGHPRAIVGALTIAETIRRLAASGSISEPDCMVGLLGFVDRLHLPDTKEFHSWRAIWQKETGRSFDEALAGTKSEMKGFLGVASTTQLPLRQVLSELGCFKPDTRGSGTASVAAAVAAYLRHPDNYRAGVLEIVNTLGIDTDTIASMYGTMVGVKKGSTHLPEALSTKVQEYEYFISAAEALVRIALRIAMQNDLRVNVDLVRGREGADIVELTRGRAVTKNQRVIHYLLGPGWVQAVSEQTVKSGGRMLLADVVFDSGQSARFRSFRSSDTASSRKKGVRSNPGLA